MKRFRRFLQEAWSELKKVTWPTRQHVRDLTILVFVVSLAVSVYISGLDLLFAQAIRLLEGLA